MIVDYIPVGADQAISMEELTVRSGLEPREVRRETLRARRAGVPICSCKHGYFIAASEREAQLYVHAQLSRLSSGYAALRPFRALIKRERERCTGQLTVFDLIEKEETANSAVNTDDGAEK